MPAGFWANVVAGFFVFVALGLVLFFIDDSFPPDWRPFVEPLRVGLLVIGFVGVASTLALRAGVPAARYGVRLSVVAGAVALVAYVVGFDAWMVMSPADQFHQGKIVTVVIGLVISVGAMGLIAFVARLIWREADAQAIRS